MWLHVKARWHLSNRGGFKSARCCGDGGIDDDLARHNQGVRIIVVAGLRALNEYRKQAWPLYNGSAGSVASGIFARAISWARRRRPGNAARLVAS